MAAGRTAICRLDTAKGRFWLRIDEVKSEIEVKREIDLLLYLRKHGFPCPQPLVDRKGRQYRELARHVRFALQAHRRPAARSADA